MIIISKQITITRKDNYGKDKTKPTEKTVVKKRMATYSLEQYANAS